MSKGTSEISVRSALAERRRDGRSGYRVCPKTVGPDDPLTPADGWPLCASKLLLPTMRRHDSSRRAGESFEKVSVACARVSQLIDQECIEQLRAQTAKFAAGRRLRRHRVPLRLMSFVF